MKQNDPPPFPIASPDNNAAEGVPTTSTNGGTIDLVAYLAHRRVVFLVLWCLSAFVWCPLMILSHYRKSSHVEYIAGLSFLFCPVFSWMFAREVSVRMSRDRTLGYRRPIAQSYYWYLGILSYLPIIGPAFARIISRRDQKKLETMPRE